MQKNYLKIAWRTLVKNKMFSLINILGLAMGMAFTLVIMLWVRDEIKMDQFHENGDRLYNVMENQHYSDGINTINATPGILAENIVKDIPEIQMASQLLWQAASIFSTGNTSDEEKGRYVQDDFLIMLSFELSQGDARTALERPDGIVISQELADKYFKGINPMGKTIRVDKKDDVIVTGVLKPISKYSSLRFDFLMSYDRWQKSGNDWSTEWGNNGPRCIVMLAPNVSVEKVNTKIKDYIKTKNKNSNVQLFLTNYGDSYLYSKWSSGKQDGGRIAYVRIFTMVAIFILVIACINFMNLATARSAARAREVGLRKVSGAYRSSLIGQFIGESLLVTIISLLFSVIITLLILPSFNELTGKRLTLDLLNPGLIGMLLGMTVVTGIVAGSYPALFMSSLSPVTILKGVLKYKPGTTYFRQGLVVFQFGLSIFLILAMIVVYQQIAYLQNKNLGFDKGNLLYLAKAEGSSQNFSSFKQNLESYSGIQSVTISDASPLFVGSSTFGVSWPGKDTTQEQLFLVNTAGFDFVKTMGINLISGRDFSSEFGTDTSNYLINEAAAKRIGYKDPIGKELMWGRKGKIIGVMKDFHIASLHYAVEPLIIGLQPKTHHSGHILIRTRPGQMAQAIGYIEKLFKEYNPGLPFKYYFADQEIGNLYRSENIVRELSNYFAGLAILISCLGLFGLAAFTAEQRTKEIGVRKVLGASVVGLVGMLAKDFVKLVAISTLVSFPAALYFLKDWLEKYAYRIEMEWWYFAITAGAALLIALLTVSFQAGKTALMNPVKALRSE